MVGCFVLYSENISRTVVWAFEHFYKIVLFACVGQCQGSESHSPEIEHEKQRKSPSEINNIWRALTEKVMHRAIEGEIDRLHTR